MIFLSEVELIVEGEVQGAGYRQYVAKIGRRLKLVGFVKNLEDGTVQIHCKGDKKTISEFKEIIKRRNPPEMPLIDVEDIKEKELKKETIKQTKFIEIYGDLNAEMSQGFSPGMNYLNLFREDTNKNFARMDEKYNAISEGMFAVVNEIIETNKVFENKIEKIESRMEKTDQNIESLLKILAEKKS